METCHAKTCSPYCRVATLALLKFKTFLPNVETPSVPDSRVFWRTNSVENLFKFAICIATRATPRNTPRLPDCHILTRFARFFFFLQQDLCNRIEGDLEILAVKKGIISTVPVALT